MTSCETILTELRATLMDPQERVSKDGGRAGAFPLAFEQAAFLNRFVALGARAEIGTAMASPPTLDGALALPLRGEGFDIATTRPQGRFDWRLS